MNTVTHRLPRRTFLRGLGATMALPLLDSMVPRLSVQAAGQDAGSTRLRLHAQRHHRRVRQEPAAVHVDAEGDGRELRVQPDDEGARAVSRSAQRVQRPGAGHRPRARRRSRRPRARHRDVPHRRASLQDRRRRLQARDLRRSDCREGARQVHAAVVDRARARGAAARRQLRLRLHLRLHVDVVARADQPAAGRNQSACGVRAAVRRRRQHRRASAHGAAREAEERARLRHRQPVAPAHDARRRRQAQARGVLEAVRDIERRIQLAEQQNATIAIPTIEKPTAIPDDYLQYQADDRHAGGGVADRHDARRVVHARPRRQQPRLSRDRHLRRPPLDLASSGRCRDASRS